MNTTGSADQRLTGYSKLSTRIYALSRFLRNDCAAALWQYRWLLGLSAIYFLVSAFCFHRVWRQVFFGFELGAWLAIITSAVFVFFMVAVLAWQISWLVPRRQGSGAFRQRIAAKASPGRLVLALPALLLLGPFSTVFGKMKILIPLLNPFAYDPWLARADAFLHGGRDAWQWLAPWLLNGPAISVLTLIYEVIWPSAVLYVLVHASLDVCARRRMQCLYAYFGTWAILGTLLAIALSSAGPVFYAHVVGVPSPYDGLMAQLVQLDAQGWITPVALGQEIWQAHIKEEVDNVAFSISAMPSLHVAMACLTFLYCRRLGRAPGFVAGAYFASIMVGSVMLGWHYALDGYVAIAGTCVIWWGAGKLAAITTAPEACCFGDPE